MAFENRVKRDHCREQQMQQREMRQESHVTGVRKVTTVFRVLDTKDRCWTAKNNGKELDMIRGVFFVAALVQNCRRERSSLENSISQAEFEQVTSTRVHAWFGVPSPSARDTLDGDVPSVSIRKNPGRVTP